MNRARRSDRFAPAHWAFFLLACGQAFVAVPLWLAEWSGLLASCSGCSPSLRHAHELLLGYAVAVIGGFLFTRLRWPGLLAAMAAWLAGRIAAYVDPSPLSALAAMTFPAALAVLAGWPFLRAARTVRNFAFAPVLLGFLVAEVLYQLGRLNLLADGQAQGVALALDLTLTMLLVMGGRLIPAAMAGLVRNRGDVMTDRNGPRLELLSLAAMAGAAVAHLAGNGALAGVGWCAAGVASALRLRRWRFTVALAAPSMWPLHMGYGCLSAGLAGTAIASWAGWWSATAVTHLATVGGLGVISVTMMVRTVMLRERLSTPYPRSAVLAAMLLLAAAAVRVAGPLAPDLLLPVAMPAWSAAFGMTAWVLLRLAVEARRTASARPDARQ